MLSRIYYYRSGCMFVTAMDDVSPTDLCYTCGHTRDTHFALGHGPCNACRREANAGRDYMPDPQYPHLPCQMGSLYIVANLGRTRVG